MNVTLVRKRSQADLGLCILVVDFIACVFFSLLGLGWSLHNPVSVSRPQVSKWEKVVVKYIVVFLLHYRATR